MYKLSVPISVKTITDDNIDIYLKQLEAIKAERVFLIGFGKIYSPDSIIHSEQPKIIRIMDILRSKGYEVGFWVCAFGHGQVLAQSVPDANDAKYTSMEGVNGEIGAEALCPLDKNFENDYLAAVDKLASLHPDILMFDDDFRMNTRLSYYMGCFCPLHLEKYYKLIGEVVPREKIEELIFTGGRNKYRSAYLKMLGDDLRYYAAKIREIVDKTDKNIRTGCCLTPEFWDLAGVSPFETAKIFAGDTKPFMRIFGAPYHGDNIIPAIEFSRLQYSKRGDMDIEIFSEGDTYPRPRYNVASKLLELFDTAMIADGNSDGILAYIFDYLQNPEYETGYIDRYVRNAPTRNAIREIFADKTSEGIYIFKKMDKTENADFGSKLEEGIFTRLQDSARSPGDVILAANSIPTSFIENDYPVFIAGENAKYIEPDILKNGAIIDITAARILTESGIDTGLISCCEEWFEGEYYPDRDAKFRNTKGVVTYRAECSPDAKILSTYNTGSPSSYLYENSDSIKFLVLAFDIYRSKFTPDFANNYYRQQQITESVHWLC